MTNLEEYLAGTDPTNALSYLKFDSVALGASDPNLLVLSFSALSNHTYTILCRDNAAMGAWSWLADIVARTTNRVVTVTNQIPAAVSSRFYRLATPQRP
jgi:hypothetical protein